MSMLSRWTGRRTNGGGMESTRREMDEGEEFGPMARPLMNLQQDINRVFEDFFGDIPSPMGRGGMMMESSRFQPRMDLSETEDRFRVCLDVPGMTEDDIDIAVSENSVNISGERSEESEADEENFYRRERSYGMFRRQIPLPEGVKSDDISASFDNGVLEIDMPKSEEAKKNWRKIEVKRK